MQLGKAAVPLQFCCNSDMVFPKNIEKKLGFDRIRAMLTEYCSGPVGATYVEKMRFSDKFHVVMKLTSQTEEFVKLLGSGNDFPKTGYIDMGGALEKARIAGAFLLEEELHDLKMALRTLTQCIAFFEQDEKGQYPHLAALAQPVTFDRSLLATIEAVIDDRGKIKDNASPELSRIRSQLNGSGQNVRKRIDQLLREYKAKGFAQESASPTLRDGRLVLPLAAEYKRAVKGFVHDTSSTGQTVYMEPEEVLHLNNEIRELQQRERYEIVRILTKVTDQVRPHVDALEEANRFLGMMDFIKAKANLAVQFEAIKPPAEDRPFIEWYHAFHPLLRHAHNQNGRSTIPQNIRLDEESRILLISGPNAGGKSVTLKTVGLLQYMFQCGLLVPVLETSKMGVFQHIFLDIGDEQSLEDDLSTYSSHLTNMNHFLRRSNARTLCLIDEFGSGTEPQLGAAIAEAILEQLNRKQVFGVLTTHYANLKFYADRTQGLVNGAMRYDVEHLRPLFQLEVGMPGSSFALEIAQNIGLPEKVLKMAKHKAGGKQISVEKLLSDLESEKKDLEDRNVRVRQKEQELEGLKQKYAELKRHYEDNKRKMMAEAQAEAETLLATANRKIENTIRAIKENQAEKNITRVMRRDLEEFKSQLKQSAAEQKTKAPAPNKPVGKKDAANGEGQVTVVGGSIEPGSTVRLKGQDTMGEVLEISGKEATVAIGQLKTIVKLSRLEKVSRKEARKQEKASNKTTVRNGGVDFSKKMIAFNQKLDVRGKRAEETLQLLTDWIDDALMLGQQQLTVVHGKGDGILRQVVRDELRKIREVKHFEDEHADRGGAGVTLVTLG